MAGEDQLGGRIEPDDHPGGIQVDDGIAAVGEQRRAAQAIEVVTLCHG